jgi:hypothetical protein
MQAEERPRIPVALLLLAAEEPAQRILPGAWRLCGYCDGTGEAAYVEDIRQAPGYTRLLGCGVCRECSGHGRVRA